MTPRRAPIASLLPLLASGAAAALVAATACTLLAGAARPAFADAPASAPTAASTTAPTGAAPEEMLNRIVLRVNDRIATLYEYERRKDELIEDTSRREQDPAERRRILAQAGELVFKDMFDDLLLQSKADQLGVDITDDQVDKQIQGTRDANGLKNDQQFRAALRQSGMTEAGLREQVRKTLRVQEVIGREVTAKIKVDDEDLRKYYRAHPDEFRVPEQVQLRDAVVPEDKVASAAERLRVAGEMRKALLAGKSMDEAVSPFQTLGEASPPADLGWIAKGDLDPALEEAAWKLPKGGVSEPVEGRGGVHVLQVLDRHDAHLKPFNEVSSAIEARERQRVYRDKLSEYMADLQKQSLVVSQPPKEAEGFNKLLHGASEKPAIPGLTPSDAAEAAAPKAPADAQAGATGPAAAPASTDARPAPPAPTERGTPAPAPAPPPPPSR